MIHVTRFNFIDEHSYNDGPEEALQRSLQLFEAQGHVIVSVSILRSTRFIVPRSADAMTDRAATSAKSNTPGESLKPFRSFTKCKSR